MGAGAGADPSTVAGADPSIAAAAGPPTASMADPPSGTAPATIAGDQPADLPLLRVRDLSRRYAGLVALSGYTLDLAPGTIHGVIGPNGAGKTTLFNLLSGMVRPTSGSIRLLGREL